MSYRITNGARQRREAKGHGREALARIVGCSSGTIYSLERGHILSDAMARRIAVALDCTPAELYEPVAK